MVSKATAVNTGRQAGAHSVAEWKKGEKMKQPTVLDTNTHTHTHTHTHPHQCWPQPKPSLLCSSPAAG